MYNIVRKNGSVIKASFHKEEDAKECLANMGPQRNFFTIEHVEDPKPVVQDSPQDEFNKGAIRITRQNVKHFYKKEWNLWEKVIEKLKEQEGTIYVSKYDNCSGLNSFHIDIEIDSKKYKLIYWVKTKTASVWHGTHCILCGYDKYHSNMAIKIMKERIKKVFDSADKETKQITKELMSEW